MSIMARVLIGPIGEAMSLYQSLGLFTSILNIIFIALLFKWKRIGFYGILMTSIIGMLSTIIIFNKFSVLYQMPITALFPAINIIVLFLLIKPQWKDFN